MRIADIMSTRVETVDLKESAETAADLMRLHRIHHLLVTFGGRFVGILSDRDVGGPRGASLRRGRAVRDLMTPNVTTIAADATVRRAANLMRGRTIGCLPVVDPRQRVVGVVTTSDLLDLLGRGQERPVARSGRGGKNLRVGRQVRRSKMAPPGRSLR